MGISYKPFIDYIEKKGISVHSLVVENVYKDNAARLIRSNKPVNLEVIDAICQHFDLPIEQVVKITKD